ncbi:integrin beta chain VWA domain-containing protein [Phthorimaea operculella]|nr:integrin beta chain VWA domain-containing protein [Phthorimaea operculella]
MFVWTWLCVAFCFGVLQASVIPCQKIKTCKACVRAVPACKWCSSDSVIFNKKNPRCVSATIAFNECPADNVENPKSTLSNIAEYNHDFSSTTQIKPQRLKITLRPGEPQAFNFSFKPSQNFPADLYFLFDSSTTMKGALRAVASAAKEIYESMKNKTSDVLIGMGTFVDKNAAPFVREKNPTNPISSYTHKLSLTEDIESFKKLVNELASNAKGNYDQREGGFDALAQAITCNIGWRDMSRKIIFFFTDALSHTAGDGKAAGILYPYDGECYTNGNGTYTKELQMDYPSIGMISELAQREGVTIIFIVENSIKKYYNAVAKHIHGSQVVQFRKFQDKITIDEHASLHKLLSKIYTSITKTIKFETLMSPKQQKNIQISFEPNCTGEGSKKDPKCVIPITENTEAVNYQGKIMLSNYYEEDNIQLPISIGSGIKEKLMLDIEIVDCDCKNKKEEGNKTEICSGHGIKKCGVCECEKNRIGDECQCPLNNNAYDDSSCKPGDENEHLPCNGGHCECGICRCSPGREGKFCECIANNCVDKCNGHGSCFCGVCTCNPGWTGETCGCSTQACYAVNGKECNGRGHCECGSCKCDDRASWDARVSQNRDTCEMSPCDSCHDEQCLKLEECVKCSFNEEPDCSHPCEGIQVDFVEELNATDRVCDVKVSTGCYTKLRYEYDDVNYQIRLFVQREENCLISYYRTGGIVLVTLVLAGLATLVVWKWLMDRRDRQEYERFLKLHRLDRDQTCQNPIYEPATTTIRNPAFRKPSVDYTLR